MPAVLTAATLTSFIGVAAAAACDCEGSRSPQQALELSDAVFGGLAISVAIVEVGGQSWKRADFAVFDCWKGDVGTRATVWTSVDGASCGVSFYESVEYLVYASDQESKLVTNACTRTDMLFFADEDLQALGEPGVCGTVSVEPTAWGRIKATYR